jgi:hypothetical protein
MKRFVVKKFDLNIILMCVIFVMLPLFTTLSHSSARPLPEESQTSNIFTAINKVPL